MAYAAAGVCMCCTCGLPLNPQVCTCVAIIWITSAALLAAGVLLGAGICALCARFACLIPSQTVQ